MKASEMTNDELAHNLCETIPFLTKEARHVTDADEIMRETAARLRNLGEFGEAVGHESTREKSSQDGNAAKLREACEALMSEIGGYLTDGLEVIWCSISGKTIKKSCAALAAPPRNCDAFSKDEVLEMLKDRSFSKEDTIEWLYDEAKGVTDESK